MFRFIRSQSANYRVTKLCRVLEVSKSSFYAWMNRPKSKREQDNEKISREIQRIKSKVARKFKATTDSNHSLPVAENLLSREF